jgi:hypothetical protein
LGGTRARQGGRFLVPKRGVNFFVESSDQKRFKTVMARWHILPWLCPRKHVYCAELEEIHRISNRNMAAWLFPHGAPQYRKDKASETCAHISHSNLSGERARASPATSKSTSNFIALAASVDFMLSQLCAHEASQSCPSSRWRGRIIQLSDPRDMRRRRLATLGHEDGGVGDTKGV